MRANGIRPLRLSRKAELSRPTILRIRKGGLGSARTRAKLLAACSAMKRRPVTEAELFGIVPKNGVSEDFSNIRADLSNIRGVELERSVTPRAGRRLSPSEKSLKEDL